MAKKQLKYNMKVLRRLHPEYVKGILFAAEFVNDYSNGHDYLIGDCLLAKLNLIEGKPRKNRKRKLSNVDSAQKEARCQKRLS